MKVGVPVRVWKTCLLGVVVTAGCAGNPVAPHADQRTAAIVAPAHSPFSAPVIVKGRVTHTPPTSITEVPNAVVTIEDGPNAGRSATVNTLGFYTLEGVMPGAFTLSAAGEGFVDGSRRVEALRDVTENFNLMPVARTMTYTLRGDVRDGDGTCSDGVANRPCRIVLIPIHNAGVVNARLEWSAASGVDLDLTLFQTNVSAPIERSSSEGQAPEAVSSPVAGGATYELRITYAAGRGQARYTITIECPN